MTYEPQPPAYGPPGYGQQQPYGYPYPPAYGAGPPGRIRPTGVTVLLFVVTFGIYTCVYNYSVHEEMKRHTGRGIGGGVALVLSFFAGIAMPFVTPNEVGNMYALRGQRKPVSAVTGLWTVVPIFLGGLLFVVTYVVVFTTASFRDGTDDYGDSERVPVFHTGQIIGLIIGPLLFITASIIGQIIYVAKTNGALNNYWAALGVRR